MPIVWIARLLGAPIRTRVSGSDIFEAIKQDQGAKAPLKAFLFGGPEGVAEAAAHILNLESQGMRCAGYLFPGYGTTEEMSTQSIVDAINTSHADILVASLGAKKGQEWLIRNHNRLHVPIRCHLGAAVNFEAGIIKRAPPLVRKLGFEWLWRIKEEPYLWRRYWADGKALLNLMFKSVLPLMLDAQWRRVERLWKSDNFSIRSEERASLYRMFLTGAATADHVVHAVPFFCAALHSNKSIVIDMSGTSTIDMRFLGLLLMLRKQLVRRGLQMEFAGLSSRTARLFRLNRFVFLLSTKVSA
jgi:N-acetylglucosaminyldiphosphoundecaprenol N-acetyl-beta-D-mannosaminyltransferase